MTAAIEQPDCIGRWWPFRLPGPRYRRTCHPICCFRPGNGNRFADNARDLLARAGGENGDMAGGRARAFLLIPRVEHITILFNPLSHAAALDWFNETFEHETRRPFTDRRMVWYGLHLLGWLLLVTAVSPLLANPTPPTAGPTARLVVRAGSAAGPLFSRPAAGHSGPDDGFEYNGRAAGGRGVGLWFWLFGLVWLAAGFRPRWPDGRELLWGLLLFACFGLLLGPWPN
jgi:hypothetical protein